jgi:hypothetical protein
MSTLLERIKSISPDQIGSDEHYLLLAEQFATDYFKGQAVLRRLNIQEGFDNANLDRQLQEAAMEKFEGLLAATSDQIGIAELINIKGSQYPNLRTLFDRITIGSIKDYRKNFTY